MCWYSEDKLFSLFITSIGTALRAGHNHTLSSFETTHFNTAATVSIACEISYNNGK